MTPQQARIARSNHRTKTTATKESKLIKRPKSQQSQGLIGSVMDVAKKSIGRDKSFTKQTGSTIDWQIGVFWIAVGGVLAAIAAGIIFGWR